MRATGADEEAAVAAAQRAHRLVAGTIGEPLFPTVVLRERSAHGLPADPGPLFDGWAARSTGSALGPVRYRWTVSARFLPSIPHMGDPASWRAWRPAEQEVLERDPWRVVARLVVPIVLAETTDFLGTLASEAPHAPTRERARSFLREALPVLRTDGAFYVGGRHAWGDTFALWCFSRRPQALRIFYPYALATAELYAEAAREAGGVLPGSRFPFHDVPLASASAQLATGLLALGLQPAPVGRLARHVASEERGSGGWGDADGPADLLTTLDCADLLLRLDPTFRADRTVGLLLQRQDREGWWRAMGPETLWLTAEIAGLLDAAGGSFAARFRWPELAREQRDRRTGLPFYSYLVDLAALYAQFPGLAEAPVELAFLDLARFGEFNNAAGMAMGDEVLRRFAAELRTLPDAVAIRDGGDEFIILGSPTATGLRERLEGLPPGPVAGGLPERLRLRGRRRGGADPRHDDQGRRPRGGPGSARPGHRTLEATGRPGAGQRGAGRAPLGGA